MKKLKSLLLFISVSGLSYSCQKCKECYLEEPNLTTGETTTTDLGKMCGEDLDNIKTSHYSSNPHAHTYCK